MVVAENRVVMITTILGYGNAYMRTTLRLTTMMMVVVMVAGEKRQRRKKCGHGIYRHHHKGIYLSSLCHTLCVELLCYVTLAEFLNPTLCICCGNTLVDAVMLNKHICNALCVKLFAL